MGKLCVELNNTYLVNEQKAQWQEIQSQYPEISFPSEPPLKVAFVLTRGQSSPAKEEFLCLFFFIDLFFCKCQPCTYFVQHQKQPQRWYWWKCNFLAGGPAFSCGKQTTWILCNCSTPSISPLLSPYWFSPPLQSLLIYFDYNRSQSKVPPFPKAVIKRVAASHEKAELTWKPNCITSHLTGFVKNFSKPPSLALCVGHSIFRLKQHDCMISSPGSSP